MSDRPPQRRPEPVADRRSVLAGVGAVGASLLAGCNALSGGPLGNGSATNTTDTATDGTTRQAPTETTETTTPPEQGFEADVVGTEISHDGRSFTFEPFIEVNEDERSTRVRRWVVETLGGEELGSFPVEKDVDGPRFQVSGTVEVPEDVSMVVIRAEHVGNGFGGFALVVQLGDWAFRRVQQGPDRESFEDFSFD